MDWILDLDQDSDQDLDLDLGPDLELDNTVPMILIEDQITENSKKMDKYVYLRL